MTIDKRIKLQFVCPQCKETQTINTTNWKEWRGTYLCDCMADLMITDININTKQVIVKFR